MIVLPAVLAVLATLVAVYLVWWEYRRAQELFTPWMLFLIYGVLDVLLPAAVFMITEPPTLVQWIVPLRKHDIASSTLIYVASLASFAAGYFLASHRRPETHGTKRWSSLADVELRLGRLYVGLVVSGGWYVLYQLNLINQAGSFEFYLSDRFRQRFRPDIFESRNIIDFVFNQFAPSMLPTFLVLVGILFFFRYRYRRMILWGWILPAVAWILTLTTFYRAYQLNLFLTLAFLETCRIRVARHRPEAALARVAPARVGTATSRHTKVLAASAVLLFLFYGAYRQYHSSYQYGNPVSVTEALTSQGGEVVRGWGVIGLASILQAYGGGESRLGGTSVASTFFMPVPRPLWPAKPERYGAEEVTRRMGWPTTTQSAITMPGEFYANFGLVGVPLVAGFGFLFRAVYRRRLHPKLVFVYAIFVPHAVLLTHWMSSSGLMTSVTQHALSVVAVFWVVALADPNDPGRVDRDHQSARPASMALSGGNARGVVDSTTPRNRLL